MFSFLLSTPEIQKVYFLFSALVANISELNREHPNENIQTPFSELAPARKAAAIAGAVRGSKQEGSGKLYRKGRCRDVFSFKVVAMEKLEAS